MMPFDLAIELLAPWVAEESLTQQWLGFLTFPNRTDVPLRESLENAFTV